MAKPDEDQGSGYTPPDVESQEVGPTEPVEYVEPFVESVEVDAQEPVEYIEPVGLDPVDAPPEEAPEP